MLPYNYKFQGQERQEELGLNWDSFKWRNYDPALGRFMNIDPLAESYPYNSTYTFQENKMGMGRELEGLELLPNDVFNYLLREGAILKTKLEAPRKNLNTAIINRVNAGISGREKSNTNVAGLNINKVVDYGVMGQSVKKIVQETKTTTKKIVRDGASGMETGGDVITTAGIVTGQPEVIAIGQGISGVGKTINATIDIAEGNYTKVTETAVKEVVTGGLGTAAKSSTNNEVQEYIIDAQIQALDKLYDEYISPIIITPTTTTTLTPNQAQ
ncbi:RHS repeat-associated core domain-containing protein [Flavobacterium sp. 28YEA47A]|uniref:RHS repeat-associated core domain-containing protein n=1 Tax=Flavobacterium sp. 28YEA47A TaxID=3156276 RepID=UPI0035160235